MKPRIREVIIVEGRYDKNAVSQAVDAFIIETSGYSIFSDAKKVELMRRLSEKYGVILFTDSDGAGFVIRNHLKGMLNPDNVKNAYIPDIYGKERRKRVFSKEGKIGVEGMSQDVIIQSLRRAGATFADSASTEPGESVTKADLYVLGLSGSSGAQARRKKLLQVLALPEKMSANAMLDVINALYTKDEFVSLVQSVIDNEGAE